MLEIECMTDEKMTVTEAEERKAVLGCCTDCGPSESDSPPKKFIFEMKRKRHIFYIRRYAVSDTKENEYGIVFKW